MTVLSILESKGNNVITANLNSTIQSIADILASKKIGAVVIVDESDKVCGIASERDVVREVSKKKEKGLEEPISVCMTHAVESCKETDTINHVMEIMTEGRFRHVPIMSDGKLLGIISIGDVVKARIEQAERDTEDMKRYIAG
ncbi:MAG: CBS domain-containing protein [Rhizobiales bacterium]|nr:CBS domain-containing protein [Hyphomicrobiales bacterium]